MFDLFEIYDSKRDDGRIIKSIHLNIPVVYDNTEKPCLSLDKNICDESVVLFTR